MSFSLRRRRARALFCVHDRSRGQVTVEYIVLLAVVVSLALLAMRLLKPIVLRIRDSGSAVIDRTMDRGNLHRSPFRR